MLSALFDMAAAGPLIEDLESEEEPKIAPVAPSSGVKKVALAVALGLGLVVVLGAGTQNFGVFQGKSSPSLDTMSKVKVWKDSLSGDELCSDDYPHKEIFDGAGLEVQGKYIKKGDRDVVNLVDEFNLNEATLSKKLPQS